MKNVSLFLLIFLILFSCEKKNSISSHQNKLDYYFEEVYNTNLSKEDRLKKLDSAIAIVNEFNNKDSLKIKNLFKVSNRYFQLFEYENYRKTTLEILTLAYNQKDSISIAKANYYLGDYYFYKTKNDSAYYYYLESDKTYKKLGIEDFNSGNAILHKAYVLLYEKDYVGSESEAINALEIANKINDRELVYECYSHLAITLSEAKDFNKSLEYNLKALNQIEKVELQNYIPIYKGQTNNNIGNIYLKTGNFNEAKKYFLEGLKIENIKDLQPVLYTSLLDYYAYSNFKTNQPSLEDFKKAMFIRDSIDDTNGKINSRVHLTEYFLEKKDSVQAFQYNTEAYNLAKKAGYNQDVLTTLDLFTKIKPKEGLQYAQEYIKLSDSLQEQERKSRNKFARIEYETDEIIGEKDAISTQKSIILFTSLTIILIVALLYLILYQRSKAKQLEFVHEQQQINEKIYQLMLSQQTQIEEVRTAEKNRIARELHDGILNRLAATRLNLFAITRRPDDKEIIKNSKIQIDKIQEIEKEIRSISHDLRNSVFDSGKNYSMVLVDLFEEQQKLYDANCIYYIDNDIPWDFVSTKNKMNLYRILQESLNNINKYANAKNINIDISNFNHKLAVTIKDDGKGFDTSKVKKGIGIQNMYDRAKECNAELNIISEINNGTTIKYIIEIDAPTRTTKSTFKNLND